MANDEEIPKPEIRNGTAVLYPGFGIRHSILPLVASLEL
jgi:hypothetical protein